LGVVERSEIRYARAGEHHIAYREYVGDPASDVEIVMVNGAFWPMESLPDDPIANRLLEGLAALGRLIVFDRRGIALSDPVTDWETPLREQWADDLAAVIAAADCDRPTVFSWIAGAVARTCSVRYPELVGRMVLWNPGAPLTEDDKAWVAEFAEGQRLLLAGEGPEKTGGAIAPGRADDPAYRAWTDAAGRAGASPSLAARLNKMGFADPPFDNTIVSTPTLVITRVAPNWVVPTEFFERAARQIPRAEHVALPSGDGLPFGVGVDDVLAEISRYLTGEIRLPAPERQVVGILFTDLVGSTHRAASTGDADWKRLLDRHDEVNRTAVGRRGGEVIKSTGDGVLAVLPSATAAIEAARTIREQIADSDLEVRIGIHVGEIDRRGADVSGLAVNVAARIMGEASAGQILVSEVVTLVAAWAEFATVGTRTLKGVEGGWRLHAVV
jgi:class 3 adenylate cyclase/pimeloyl-ACP methyl ester carboxylesterase